MKTGHIVVTLGMMVFLLSCMDEPVSTNAIPYKVYRDTVFRQEFSIRYPFSEEGIQLQSVAADRNGSIRVLTSQGLLQTRAGQFLFPGELAPDHSYRTSRHKKVAALETHQEQFVFLDDQALYSQAWAGELFIPHNLPEARLLAGGRDFTFLISDGEQLELLHNSAVVWSGGRAEGTVLDIQYGQSTDLFYILYEDQLLTLSSTERTLQPHVEGTGLTAFALSENTGELFIGTNSGFWEADLVTGKRKGELHSRVPVREISCLAKIEDRLWVGSERGAYCRRPDGKFNYYYGRRWMPGERVRKITAGPGGSVLMLTDGGLAHLQYKEMTLRDKADYYQRQVRERHIRLGFNASLGGMTGGDITGGYLSDSDNDGLWTAMYIGAEVFRYVATGGSADALQNCREAMAAMERLYTINPVPGFPARSFERSGYIQQLADPHRWQNASDPEWDWKATTSSDEAIGHMFAFGVVAELIEDEPLREQAILLMDTLMQHILDNDLYLVDYNGKPTQWGRWNPDYVNGLPASVGDRKLNSSNIIGMLQTAYHFTGKERYKAKAYELIEDFGYLENLLRPMSEIGRAGEEGDDFSRMLSDGWNHSDDEMYFLGYWGLYRYAFTDSLRHLYREAILDHWQTERPEKEAAWNILTALVQHEDPDIDAAAWYLREYPLDLVHWTVQNSHRHDIDTIPPNFRGQTTAEVLPPDELPVARHNSNRFRLDGGNGGRSEYSAGDIWLLPYWAGRYFGVISGGE